MKLFYGKSLTALLFALFVGGCAPTIYQANSFNAEKSKMKTLAILPFSATIDSKRLPKGATIETIKESQQQTGYDLQSNVYSAFLQKQNGYSVEFQDIDKTNALLKKAGITYEDIVLKEKSELCTILGVTGIISGRISMSKPMSEAGAVAMAFMFGMGGSTNKADVALTIHQAEGKLLWKYDYAAKGSLGSSAESIAKGLMKNVSKKFPYLK